VQEAVGKIAALRERFPGLEWRLIGPLQANKARTALQWFRVVETLDRERLAARLETLLSETGETLPVLLEINVGREESKSGVLPEDADKLCAAALSTHLDVRGVMAVPPTTRIPEKSRPFFRQLRTIRDGLAERFRRSLPELDGHEPRLPRGRRGRRDGSPHRNGPLRAAERRERRRVGCGRDLRRPIWADGPADRDHRGGHLVVNPDRATRSFASSGESPSRSSGHSAGWCPCRAPAASISPLFVLLIVYLLTRFVARLAYSAPL
jgi:hypothetical protein